MSMTEIPYFAYGSNLDVAQMARRCPQARVLCRAWLPGYTLGFTRYSADWRGGVADILPAAEGTVWGLLYALTEADLAALDVYEGYPRWVETDVGTRDSVWTYQVVQKSEFVPPIRRYLEIITTAATGLEFPSDYQLALQAVRVAT